MKSFIFRKKADGRNYDAFMGIELIKDGMKGIRGKFYESEIYNNLTKEEAEEFIKKFPPLKKLKFPCYWD